MIHMYGRIYVQYRVSIICNLTPNVEIASCTQYTVFDLLHCCSWSQSTTHYILVVDHQFSVHHIQTIDQQQDPGTRSNHLIISPTRTIYNQMIASPADRK